MDQDLKKAIVFWLIPLLLFSLWYFREIIFPLLAGIILGLAIQTFSFFLNYKLKINYYLNVFLIYTLLIIFTIFFFYLTSKVIIEEAPMLLQKLEPYLKQFNLNFFTKLDFFKKSQNFLLLSDYLPQFFKGVYNFIGGIFSLVLIFIVSFYVALNKNFPQEIFSFFKNEKEEYTRLWRKIKRKISFWFLGQLSLMFFIGLATYLFLGLVLKISYAPLISFLAGVLEIVPVVGPLFSLLVALFITYLERPEFIFFVIGYFLLIQQLENHFLVPLLMKRVINLNPLLVILGILIGGKIGGILGIIIILPLLGAFVEILNYFKSKS